MAKVEISSLNASAAVNKVWRKIQGKLGEGANFMVEEFDMLTEFSDVEFPWSQREVAYTTDVNEAPRAATIPDGGFRSRPVAVNTEELTASMSSWSQTFVASTLAKYADEGNENQIVKELVHKSKKALQSIERTVGQQFYGTSVGTIALTDTDLGGTTDTIVLKDAFGVPDIDNAAYLSELFRKGDRIAFIDGSAIADSNAAFSEITANPKLTPGSIDVTHNSSLNAVSNNNLKIVGAASLGNGSSTDPLNDTDYNKALTGLFDVLQSASVGGLAQSSVPEWDVSYEDTAGGHLSTARIHKALDTITNASGKTPDICLMSQGVNRAIIEVERAAYHAASPMGIELDGSFKRRGIEFKTTRRVPPGYAFFWKKNQWQKLMLTPKPTNKLSWADGIDLIDKEGMLFPIFMAGSLICRQRNVFGYFSGLTEA